MAEHSSESFAGPFEIAQIPRNSKRHGRRDEFYAFVLEEGQEIGVRRWVEDDLSGSELVRAHDARGKQASQRTYTHKPAMHAEHRKYSAPWLVTCAVQNLRVDVTWLLAFSYEDATIGS